MNLYESINSFKEGYADTVKYRMNNDDDLIVIKKDGKVISKGMVDDLKDNWNDFDDFKFDEEKKAYVCKHDGSVYTVEKILVEADGKVCVLCGKHFREWGNDPWPLAEEGWCCDKCNMDKVVPARIALAYKKEEPKTEEKKEAEYGDGARHYSNALIDLCEQGIISWENVAHGLINYCSEDEIADFCESYQYKDLIDNPTGDDSLEGDE